MKKIIIIAIILSFSVCGFGQNFYVSGKDTLTGRPGYWYQMKPLYVTSPLYRINDSTIGINSQAFDTTHPYTWIPTTPFYHRFLRSDITTATDSSTTVVWIGSSNLATNNNQINSPSLGIYGQGWGTTNSRSYKVGMTINYVPTQGAATPAGSLLIRRYIESVGQATLLTLSNGGDLTATGNITASGGIVTASNFVSTPRVSAGNNSTFIVQGGTFNNNSSSNLMTVGGGMTNTNNAGTFMDLQVVPNYNTSGTAAGTDFLISRFEQALGSGAQYLIRAGTSSSASTTSGFGGTFTPLWSVDNKGKEYQSGTLTAAGTTGAQTINKPCGSVNFAASAQTLVVTNSLATTSSGILLSVMTDDATAKSAVISALSAGSFTIKLNAAATAETKVFFRIVDAQ